MRALYFDGRSAQGREVDLVQRHDELLACSADETQAVVARWALADVRWPERTRHGQRLVRLPDGGELHVADGAAFDAWRAALGHREGWVVRAQQHWRATLAAAAGLVLLVAAGYLWGVPVAARAVVALLPAAVDAAVGRTALESIEERWLRPSRLPPAREAELQRQLAAALTSLEATDRPQPVPWTIQLRAGGETLGANAFALPGGTIVVTDELVELLEGQPATLLGVLGHEWGHLRHRHGMRAVAQASLLALATSLVLGDVSSVIAGVPAMVGQLGYSRDAEREADAEAVRVLRAAGLSPAAMVVLFERLQVQRRAKASGSSSPPPLALASHPLDEERIAYFRAAAAAR